MGSKTVRILLHHHRFGVDAYDFTGGYGLSAEGVAVRLGVDYEQDREDEYIEIAEGSEVPDIPDVDAIPDPDPDETEENED